MKLVKKSVNIFVLIAPDQVENEQLCTSTADTGKFYAAHACN